MCQGIEVVLKALLIYKDKSKYGPKLRREYGHDLVKLADEVLRVYKLKPMSQSVRAELVFLSKLYESHFLRYGDARELVFNAGSIQDKHLVPRLVAAMKLARAPARRAHSIFGYGLVQASTAVVSSVEMR
jgi:hypothetical protein